MVWFRVLEDIEVGIHDDQDLVEGGQFPRSLCMGPLRLEDRQPDSGLRTVRELSDQRIFRAEVVRWQAPTDAGGAGYLALSVISSRRLRERRSASG